MQLLWDKFEQVATGIVLDEISKNAVGLRRAMSKHYSAPNGFVGRSICYSVRHEGVRYGYIVGGSTPKHLPGRDKFFGEPIALNSIVNNIFFHIEPVNGYPMRNFSSRVVREWRTRIVEDWTGKYGDPVIGFETLVELPRTGELYRRDGWTQIGVTKGYTCKRIAGKGTDRWTGKRVWDTDNLRPKLVFARSIHELGASA